MTPPKFPRPAPGRHAAIKRVNGIRAAAALALLLAGATGLAAQEVCEPVSVNELIGCSLEAAQEARLPQAELIPQLAGLEAGRRADLAEIFADDHRRAGQGRLTLSGLLSASGTACVEPVAALDTIGQMMSGAIDEETAEQSAHERAARVRERVEQMEEEGGISAQIEALTELWGESPSRGADRFSVLVPDEAQGRDVVLKLSSPAAYGLSSGMAGPAIHSGATGWDRRATSGFIVQLPGTTPADLQPGERYAAVSEAPQDEPGGVLPTMPGFYFSWHRSSRTFGHTIVGGRLEGHVVIEEINDAAVYGYLELSGTAWVETELRENTEHGSKLLDRTERTGALTLRGSFEAPNDGVFGGAAIGFSAVAVDARGGERAPTLSVERYFPPSGARNADVADPGLTVVFDRPLDPESTRTAGARIEFRDASGQMERIDLDLDVGGDTLHLRPVRELEPAAWYRVVIEGGAQGPQGHDGAQMAGPFGFTFATAPEKFDITPSLFQVVRDAPLIAGKQTLTRLYVEWERPEDIIHESWHVKTIPADSWVTDETKRTPLYPAKEKVEVPNHELTTEEEKRLARNTVNFFGWQPELREAREAFGFIQPRDPCDQPLEEEDGNTTVTWSDLQKKLNFDYYMVRVGNWTEGASSSARDLVHRIVAAAETFTLQTFPVTNVTGRFAGDFLPSEEWREQWEDALAKSHKGARLRLLREIELQVATHSDADLVVVFMPPDMWSGGASYQRDWDFAPPLPASRLEQVVPMMRPEGEWVHFLMPFTVLGTVARAVSKPVITHEIGHNYGLQHVPYVANVGERRELCRSGGIEARGGGQPGPIPDIRWYEGIEGFRLSREGDSGANKSFEEGNGETKWGLLPLMYPCAFEYDKHFIMRDHYLSLINELSRFADAGSPSPGEGRSWPMDFASILFPKAQAHYGGHGTPSASEDALHYIVTGTLGTPGTASVDRVVPVRQAFAHIEQDGDVTLVFRDADGNTLAQRTVAPIVRDQSGGPFAAVVTSPEAPHSVELRHGDTRLALRERSPAAPEIAEFRVEEITDDELALVWSVADDDGDPLSFTVLFQRDADDPWRVVTPTSSDSKAHINRAALPPGAHPHLRLIASDRMNRTHADLDAGEVTRDPAPKPAAPPINGPGDIIGPAEMDAGPPRYGEVFRPQAEDDGASRLAAVDPLADGIEQEGDGSTATIALGGEVHQLVIDRCERKSLGGLGSAIELKGRSGTTDAAHLVVSVSIVDMDEGGHHLVEAREVEADGSETALYVAMRREQGGAWQSGLGAPVEGPMLAIEGTLISGSGEFFERSGAPQPIGEGRIEAHCADLAD